VCKSKKMCEVRAGGGGGWRVVIVQLSHTLVEEGTYFSTDNHPDRKKRGQDVE
jgi:hypothetical protein